MALLLWNPLDESHDVKVTSFSTGLSKGLVLVAVTFALLSMVLRGFLTFLPMFLVERGSTLAQAGFFTSLMLCVGLVAQPLGGAVYDRIGGRAIFFICAVATGMRCMGLYALDWSHGSGVDNGRRFLCRGPVSSLTGDRQGHSVLSLTPL